MKLAETIAFKPALHQAARGVSAAAGFNVAGMSLMLAFNHYDWMPVWPAITSIAVGIFILVLLNFTSRKHSRPAISSLFALNVISVSTALVFLNLAFAAHLPQWTPFRPAQLGCLFAALVAPSFLLGVFAISAHVGVSITQYLMFSPEVRSHMTNGEPAPVIAFALAGLFILVYRYRTLVIQKELVQSQWEASTIRVLAEKFLYIRDLMNSPLQSLTASIDKLKLSSSDRLSVERCERALDRLNQLNQLLKQHEAEPTRDFPLSFDAEASLRTNLRPK